MSKCSSKLCLPKTFPMSLCSTVGGRTLLLNDGFVGSTSTSSLGISGLHHAVVGNDLSPLVVFFAGAFFLVALRTSSSSSVVYFGFNNADRNRATSSFLLPPTVSLRSFSSIFNFGHVIPLRTSSSIGTITPFGILFGVSAVVVVVVVVVVSSSAGAVAQVGTTVSSFSSTTVSTYGGTYGPSSPSLSYPSSNCFSLRLKY
mmetsp:Transcript_10595/g.12013  ORF Transcript_10595/g.12013 Transcript_10595/m.12013 type:complete len:201 (+) Transcript_10595:1847-2449(+)